MRKRSFAFGAAAIVAGLLGWWLLHKGGGGEHGASVAPVAPPAPVAAVRSADAPAPAGLAGHVTDTAGKAIAGAVVRLAPRRADRREAVAVRTGADGAYVFDRVTAGRYVVSAGAAGFVPRDGGELALAAGDHRTLELQLAAGGVALTGTVTDATGGPIGGVLIEAARERGVLTAAAPDVAAGFTDDSGRYTLSVAEGRHRVAASHAEYVGADRRVEVGRGGAVADFALVPGGAIEGMVEDAATGQGVAGARLEIARETLAGGPGGPAAGPRRRATVIADGAGHFRVTGLEPGTIRLDASAPGRASPDPTVVSLGVAEQVTGVIVVVQAAPSVSGKIVDADGKPVADATALLVGPGEMRSGSSDAAGAFTIEGVQPGRYTIAGRGDGYLDSGPAAPIVVERAPVAGVLLTLRHGAMIRGRVEPAQAAHVEIARDPATMGGGLDLRVLMTDAVSAEAGPDGAFELGPVAPGTVEVAARAADGRRGRASVAVEARGADGVVIHLDDGATLAGRVTDGKDAVAGAVVSARLVKGASRTTVIINGVETTSERAVAGADGRFTMVGLTGGDYELQVLDEQGAPYAWRAPASKDRPAAPIRVTVAPHEKKSGVELVIERPHGVIKGVVVGVDGAPVADAWVSASRGLEDELAVGPQGGAPREEASESRMMVVRTEDGDDDGGLFGGVPPVLTGADGRFELRNLRRGTYALLAEGVKGQARGGVHDVVPDADVTIKLVPLTELSGTVSANGAPVGDFTVELEGAARRSQRFLAAGGRFTMQRIDPGTYDVIVTAAEGTGHAPAVVQAGQRTDVQVALVGHGKIVGRIVDGGGAPIAGAPVISVPFAGNGALSIQLEGPPETTGADGGFAIESEPGKRLLVGLGGGGPIVMQPIDVASGATLDLGTITAKPHAMPPGHEHGPGSGPGPGPGPGPGSGSPTVGGGVIGPSGGKAPIARPSVH